VASLSASAVAGFALWTIQHSCWWRWLYWLWLLIHNMHMYEYVNVVCIIMRS